MIHIVWSPDGFLVQETVSDLLSRAPEGAEVLTLDASADGADGLAEALVATSLFASERIVALRGAEALRASAADELARLATSGVAAHLVVGVVADREPKRLLQAFGDAAKVHRLAVPRRGELIAWTLKRIEAAGLEADRKAVTTLVDAVGDDLRAIAQAVDQLATRLGTGGAVSEAAVVRHFPGSSPPPAWELFDALCARDAPTAFGVLRRLLDGGNDPIPLLFALVSQVRYVLRAAGEIERSAGLSDADLSRELGVSRGRATVLRRQAGRLDRRWLLAVYRRCAEADIDLKGGDEGAALPSELVLERLIGGALTDADAIAVSS